MEHELRYGLMNYIIYQEFRNKQEGMRDVIGGGSSLLQIFALNTMTSPVRAVACYINDAHKPCTSHEKSSFQ